MLRAEKYKPSFEGLINLTLFFRATLAFDERAHNVLIMLHTGENFSENMMHSFLQPCDQINMKTR